MVSKIQLKVCYAQSKRKMKLWYITIPSGHNPHLNEKLNIINTNQEKNAK
jgi:hypothetical protein